MKYDKTIESMVEDGLCTGCGTCSGICPRDAVDMVIDHRQGLYVPRLDKERCNECGLCFQACPGHGVDFKQLNLDIFGRDPDDSVLGNYVHCYLSHATDYDIRYHSASGGLVTALLVFALEDGLIDGALVTRMRRDRPLEPQPFIARTREEIVCAAKSKYCPVPANVALKEILSAKEGEKFAVVGLPCHVQGVRKAEAVNRKLRNRIALHFGIVCSHSDSFLGTEFTLHKHGIKSEHVVQLHYRGQGWPGSARVCLDDGTEKTMPFREFMSLHTLNLFTPKRCMLCCDMIARLADISFMDAWLPKVEAQDQVGKSIIVSRTEMGEKVCQSAKSKLVVELEKVTGDTVLQSQGKIRVSNKDLKVNFYLSRLTGRSVPNYTIRLPKPILVSYPLALLLHFNIWVSSQRYLRKFMNPLLCFESPIRRVKSKAR